jgi:alkylation response protein AidB-like acyl-CoA dehydrogenase
MDLNLNEEQQLLQDSARDFLRQECPMTHVRAMEDDVTGYSPELWHKMADLGWPGLMFPEQYGGSDYTFVELCVLMEECGRALLPSPFHATVLTWPAGVVRWQREPKNTLSPGYRRGAASWHARPHRAERQFRASGD